MSSNPNPQPPNSLVIPREEKTHRIHWKRRISNPSKSFYKSCGGPRTEADAKLVCDELNERYPDIDYWVEPVASSTILEPTP